DLLISKNFKIVFKQAQIFLHSWNIEQRAEKRQESGTFVLQEAQKSFILKNLKNFKSSPKWV
ncbi:hypothetical protein MXB_1579, partial [Myxobolus squamalis]